jgi:chemotaxis family two-component system sensor kinase Cph1
VTAMPGQSVTLPRGGHACHFFKGPGEQKAVMLPFFREGLENGEHCIYVTTHRSVEDWYLELQAYGVDVPSALESGALQIIEKDVWRPPGDFKPLVKAREVLGLIESLLQDFKGVRIAGDAAWALNPDMPMDQLCHWEATANLVYEGQDVRAICEYNLEEQSPAAIHTALKTHRLAVIDGRLRENPFCEAPRLLEMEPDLYGSDADAEMADELLTQLRSDN